MTREEAIDIIRKNIPLVGIGATEMTDALTELIPELRESENEKIRTLLVALVQWAKTINQSGLDPNTANKMLSYLEKQKEQKPAEKQDYSGLNDLERAILRGFLCAGVENVPVGIIKDTASECMGFLALIEPKPAEWSEEDKDKVAQYSR